MTVRPLPLLGLTMIAAMILSGCVANGPAETGSSTLTVKSTADGCEVSASAAPSGRLVFSVSNEGEQATEFYLLAGDGLRVVGEVENVGPGITRDLVVNAQPGNYFTVCKPGMVGSGVGKAAFTVTDSGTTSGPSGNPE